MLCKQGLPVHALPFLALSGTLHRMQGMPWQRHWQTRLLMALMEEHRRRAMQPGLLQDLSKRRWNNREWAQKSSSSLSNQPTSNIYEKGRDFSGLRSNG